MASIFRKTKSHYAFAFCAVKIPMAIFFTKMPFDIGHSFRIGKEKDLIFVLSIILPQNPEILKSKKL